MSMARFLAGLLLAGSATGLALGFTHLESVETPVPQSYDDFNAPYDGLYHFVRVRYSSGGGGSRGFGRRRGGGAMWAHDYPRAERNFLSIMSETTFVGSLTEGSNVLAFDDPELFKYPISYIVEVGAWSPSEAEIESLGNYLLKGGFLIVDDFRGGYELDNLEFHLKRALPDMNMVMVDDADDILTTIRANG